MSVKKQTLLNGAPKRPRTDGAHPGMTHQTIVAGERATVRGITATQVAHMLRGDEVHKPSRGKALAAVEINPGTRSRRNDSPVGTVAPAAIVDRAAPGAVKLRRV